MTDHMEVAAALLRASRAGKVSMVDLERQWSNAPEVRMAARPWADYGDEDPGAGSLADVGEQVARCEVWQTGGMVVEDLRVGGAPMGLDDVMLRVRQTLRADPGPPVLTARNNNEGRETDSPLMDAVDGVALEYSDEDGASLYIWPEIGGCIAFCAENSAPKMISDYTLVKVPKEKARALAKGILRATGGEP